MLKRFYSKRSGFTLVEIVVAFAVFSIMASMIAQILDLAISARNSNNLYAQELARQEQLLTVIQKDQKYYNATDKTGDYTITLTDGTTYTMGYQVKSTDPTAANQAEGINYFLSPVDYECGPASDDSGDLDSDVGGASQTSRMDTRITGTQGLGDITIYKVVKDEYAYPDDSPFKLQSGHTRYWFEIAASGLDKNGVTTLREEDVPYSQYRLYFYSDQLDAAKSSVTYTQSSGDKYTKDVYKSARVVDCGFINTTLEIAARDGLSLGETSDGSTVCAQNHYTVQQLGSNSVRIGSPFSTDGGKSGVRFVAGSFTRFYVEFEGDPNLTVASFGKNAVVGSSGECIYRACPVYKDEYNTDGTPAYKEPEDGSVHPCIYGGYMYTKHKVEG